MRRGPEPPSVWVNESDVWFTERFPGVTVKLTGIVMGLSATAPPLVVVAVTVMVPVYVPAESSPGRTETVIAFEPAWVVPESGPTNSQLLPPLAVEKATE